MIYMGLFDKFKNKKERQKDVKNEEPKVIQVKNGKKLETCEITHNSNTKIKKEFFELTREEAEEYINNLKKQIENSDYPQKKGLYKYLDELFKENWGTDEEKEEIRLRKEKIKLENQKSLHFHDKYDEARKLMRGLEYEKAIKSFKEILTEDKDNKYVSPLIYNDLSDCYYYIDDYDNAIEILKKGLEATKDDDKLHSFFESEIKRMTSLKIKDMDK